MTLQEKPELNTRRAISARTLSSRREAQRILRRDRRQERLRRLAAALAALGAGANDLEGRHATKPFSCGDKDFRQEPSAPADARSRAQGERISSGGNQGDEFARPKRAGLGARSAELVAGARLSNRGASRPCRQIGLGPRRQRPLARDAALGPAQALARLVDARFDDRREEAEIDVHRLERARAGVDQFDVAAGDVVEERADRGRRRGAVEGPGRAAPRRRGARRSGRPPRSRHSPRSR